MPAEPASAPWGLVLAAGAGRRYGGPKALVRTSDGTPWIARAVDVLRDGGCAGVLVALGAAAEEASVLVPAGVTVVRVDGWSEGVSASLRAGLRAAEATSASGVVVVPVDTPDLPAAAVARVIRGATSDALVSASYRGRPGHPVLLGRERWAAIAASVSGDIGARPYLAAQDATVVECGDLWDGADHDVPPVR